MVVSSFAAELARFGPDAPWPDWGLAEARAYCRRLTRSHYENFQVASWFLPKELRPHFHSIYAYCRWADDLADEVPEAGRSELLLDWWEGLLRDCYAGHARHPVFVALRDTVERFEIPSDPLADLLTAFRRDQRQTRYETRAELLDYCRYSANPVGRLVLHLGRSFSETNAALSDDVCTGLQLANFWQDVAEDYRRGRIYLPRESWRRHGYAESSFAAARYDESFRAMLREEVDVAEGYLQRGHALVRRLPRPLRLDVDLIVRGGQAVLRAIRRQDYNVWLRKPRVGKATQLRLLLAAWWHAGNERPAAS